jgi:hypothetical protein
MIRWLWAFVDRPLDRFGRAADFWCAVTDSTLSPRRGDAGEFATFLPRASHADPYLKLQGVLAGDGGAHLDIDVDDVDAVTHAAVEEHGASLVRREGTALSVLRTPGGQLFCVTRWGGEARRPPVTQTADRDRSSVNQLCLDIGPEHFDREVRFWSGFTGWAARPTDEAEFTRLAVPGTLPVRILLQRRDEPAPAGAHIDISCGDEVARCRARHEAFGARWVADGASWQVMRDPAGGLYCLTDQDPYADREVSN